MKIIRRARYPNIITALVATVEGATEEGKQKKSSNRDRALVTKSIQDLAAVMGSHMSSGENSNELGFAMMQMK